MPSSPQPDPIEPMLREAEAELRRRLHEACEAEASDMRTESSEEIRRLEDSLLQAVVAAEQTIKLRKQRQQRDEAKLKEAHAELSANERESATPDSESAEHVTTVREFCDPTGQQWRAWSVIPGLARPSGYATKYLGEYHKGWLCFESLQGAARRRLPRFPEDWSALDAEGLARLLQQAITAPDRKSGLATPKSAKSDRGTPAAGA